MKTITLVSLVTLSLIYATAETKIDVAMEYEHALKSASSVESMPEDMSKMKAMGKCGADQKANKPVVKKEANSSSTVTVEYEHALKSPSSEESPLEDMSKMKAMGKCGADQKMDKPVAHHSSSAGAEASLELEHAIKSPSSVESPTEDMSKMKAMGKCGSDK
jgi:hypothetical protein